MRYFIELSYNGTGYNGWQRQVGAPSVQQTLEEALSTLLGAEIEVTGAGRTDTGVHAAYYVAHFDTAAEFTDEGAEVPHLALADPQDFVYHLNAILPSGIAVRGITRVADDCAGSAGKHARYDALEREYTYYIVPFKDPFRTDTAWQYTAPLDMDAMNEAAAHLLRADDFTSFAKLGSGNRTNICRVTKAAWRRGENGTVAGHPAAGGELIFTIRADRFLRNMVRAIVGTLVDVGRGKLTPQRFAEIIDARDLSLASGGAPARGLFLTDIKYDTNLKPNRS